MKIFELRDSLENFPDDVDVAIALQCDECDGTGIGETIVPGDELAPPRRMRCAACNGSGWGPLITDAG